MNFTWSDDYDTSVSSMVTANGTRYRAMIERDDYADKPDGDLLPTVLRVEFGYGGRVTVDIARSGMDDDMRDSLAGLIERHGTRTGPDMFARYVRVFHDGDTHQMAAGHAQGEPLYVSVISRASWDAHCRADWPVDARDDEWEAFISGDVFHVLIERATAVDENGAPTEWTSPDGYYGPYYGENEARQWAEEELSALIRWEGRREAPDVRPTLPPTMVRVEPGDDIDHTGELIARAHARGLGVSVVIDGAPADLA